MNTTSKWISLPLTAGLLLSPTPQAYGMKIDPARDCKQMMMAQKQVERSTRLLTSPTSHSEKVDIRSEYAALNIAGIKLRVLGKNKRCGLSLETLSADGVGESVILRSTSPRSASIEDKMDLNEAREILSWRQVNKNGLVTVYNFGPSGEVVAKNQSQENL